MGTAPNGYNTPKTNWQANNVPLASDFNRIEGNIQAIEENLRTIDPAQVPTSNQGSLRQLLDWFANRIKAITGKTNWYDAPSKTLEDLNAHINNTNNPHNTTYSQVGAAPASHTHTPSQISPQGAGSGLDADLLDGLHASSFVNKAGDTMTGLLTIQRPGATLVVVNTDYTGTENRVFFGADANGRLVLRALTGQGVVIRNSGDTTDLVTVDNTGLMKINGNTVWHAGSFLPGPYAIATDNTIYESSSTTPTRVAQYYLGTGGGFRIVFNLWSVNGNTVYGRIYKNGVAVGTLRSTTSTSPVVFTEDISGWQAGDFVQLYLWSDTPNYPARTNLFRIHVANGPYVFKA